MSTKTKNSFTNFLYRIFIEVEPVDDKPLELGSNDPVEAELAASQAKIDEKYAKPAAKAGKGKSKFKVEEAELSEVKETKAQKQTSKEDLER